MMQRVNACSVTALVFWIAAIAFFCTVPSLADTLILKDGSRFEGRLVQEREKTYVFAVEKYGTSITKEFAKDQVQEYIRSSTTAGQTARRPGKPPASKPAKTPVRTGPACVILPLSGTFGVELTDELLARALAVAASEKPDVVILEIDSPGGSVDELQKMVRTLSANRKLHIVAYVREADSAAALFALACPKVIMAPGGSIGGAVVFELTPEGTPKNIDEKMRSILEAQFRSAAEKAGHNALLVQGMMRTDIELGIVSKDGKPHVVRGPGDELLKAKGTIMTLTAKQAVDCGLALGTADAPESCNALLGIRSWRVVPSRSRAIIIQWAKDAAAASKRFDTLMESAQDFYDKAGELDPSNGDYVVMEGTGEFTPESRKQWQARSAACSKALAEAEKRLTAAQSIASKYPQLEFSLDRLKSLRKEMAAIRSNIDAQRNARAR